MIRKLSAGLNMLGIIISLLGMAIGIYFQAAVFSVQYFAMALLWSCLHMLINKSDSSD